MIIVASQRGNALKLGRHLLNDHDNEVVEVHRIKGFVSDAVEDAMQESHAISKGTKCEQHLFSVSLSAPKNANATISDYEDAIDRIAHKMNLENQPHVVVFHEKEGRRHCHAVWCRIDAQQMKAVNLPYYKNKMAELSKELYLEHGWQLPQGHIDRSLRNPLNFSLAQWQQAKRLDEDPKRIKTNLLECWALSEDKTAFNSELERHGYYLTKGDRRSFVCVDWRGETYSLSKWLGVKKKELTEKLGAPANLPSVTDTKANIDQRLKERIHSFRDEIKNKTAIRTKPLLRAKDNMLMRHNQEREVLEQGHATRLKALNAVQVERFKSGWRKMWQQVSGEAARVKDQNNFENYDVFKHHQEAKDTLIFTQMTERSKLQERIDAVKEQQYQELDQVKKAVIAKLPHHKVEELSNTLNTEHDNHGFSMDL